MEVCFFWPKREKMLLLLNFNVFLQIHAWEIYQTYSALDRYSLTLESLKRKYIYFGFTILNQVYRQFHSYKTV